MRRFVTPLLVVAVVATSCGGDGGRSPAGAPGSGAVVTGSVSRLRTTLRSMLGKPVVVNYWATWCGPCKQEMPRLTAAARRFAGRVHFLGVNVEDDAEAARRFAVRYRMPFRSLTDVNGEIRRQQDVLGLPVTQFYRADGELAFVHQGEIEADDLTEKIEELIRIGEPVGEREVN